MTFKEFNALNKSNAIIELQKCCGSKTWINKLSRHFPFDSEDELISIAHTTWYQHTKSADWLEAFTHHPKIGDTKQLEKKFVSTAKLASSEQQGVMKATSALLKALVAANKTYEKKFGFIFIVCATGKSALEMLNLLTDRLQNNKEEELLVAMGEQHKITTLRMMKMLPESNWSNITGSQLTTHVLDTSIGKPGANLTVRLKFRKNNNWHTMAQGRTNNDGRITDLLPPGFKLNRGTYQLLFETGNYFNDQKLKGFYPQVEIQFMVDADQHYHVPLLLNPYGYSTYRGS